MSGVSGVAILLAKIALMIHQNPCNVLYSTLHGHFCVYQKIGSGRLVWGLLERVPWQNIHISTLKVIYFVLFFRFLEPEEQAGKESCRPSCTALCNLFCDITSTPLYKLRTKQCPTALSLLPPQGARAGKIRG